MPLTDLLIVRTEGNPFFLAVSVRTLAETGVLVGERDACRLGQALSGVQVPATVQAKLAARIDRSRPTRRPCSRPWRCWAKSFRGACSPR
jgi:predicted ATPase